MTHHRPHLDEMLDFAKSIPEDFGPMFGSDVVKLIDQHRALVEVAKRVREGLGATSWVDWSAGKMPTALLGAWMTLGDLLNGLDRLNEQNPTSDKQGESK